MNVLSTLGLVFLVSFMVEAGVEYVFGTPMDKVEKLKPYKWALMYIALGAGVAAAFLWQFDFVSLLSQAATPQPVDSPIPPTVYGMVLTGLTIGRGSNAVHDLITSIFKVKTPKSQ